jgi:hypothetical protein
MASLPDLVKANLGFICIIAGLAAAVRPMKSILLGRRSRHWRRVKAVVASSKLDRDGNDYFPNVIYRYSVNGREHMDGTFSFAMGDASTKAYCVDFVRRHPEGKEILVYVDPSNPELSVIEPGVHWTAYRNVALTVALFTALGFAWQRMEAQ